MIFLVTRLILLCCTFQGNNDDLILNCCTHYCKDKARDYMPKDKGRNLRIIHECRIKIDK